MSNLVDRRRLWMLLMVCAALLLLVVPVMATDNRSGDTVIVPATEVVDDDLLITGNRVIIEGTVKGDLIAFASEVVVNGTVEGSFIAGAQTIVVNGTIDGSTYVGGTAVTLGESAEIGRNLYFGGLSATLLGGSQVGRSVHTASYQTILNGNVAQDVVLSSSAVEINGTVGGDVRGEVQVPTAQAAPSSMFVMPGNVTLIEQGLRIADSAEINGVVSVSEIVSIPVEPSVRPPFTALAVTGIWLTISQRVGELIALMVIGSLFIWLAPIFLTATADSLSEKPWQGLGWGFMMTVVFPFAVLLALAILLGVAILGGFVSFGYLARAVLAVGGAAIGFGVALFGFALFMLSKVIVGYLGGRWALQKMMPDRAPSKWNEFWALLLGVAVYELLRVVPFLGPIVAAVVIFFGIGAMFLAWRARSTKAVSAPAEPKPVVSPA